MIVYHRTYAADVILTDGFGDAEGTYMTDHLHSGVWVAERPLDENESAGGDRVLSIDIPETVIADFEWAEDGKPHREWLVPAKVLNQYSVTEVMDLENL
jgi:hypothetical protein